MRSRSSSTHGLARRWDTPRQLIDWRPLLHRPVEPAPTVCLCPLEFAAAQPTSSSASRLSTTGVAAGLASGPWSQPVADRWGVWQWAPAYLPPLTPIRNPPFVVSPAHSEMVAEGQRVPTDPILAPELLERVLDQLGLAERPPLDRAGLNTLYAAFSGPL